jgi:hypothetical protein
LFAVVMVLSFSLIPAALVGASPGPGIAALWHLDEGTGKTAYDSTANNNDGTLSGGKFGNALSFDGVDDRVEVSHSPSLDISGTAITLEAWINANTFPASGRVNVISKVHAYALQVSDGGKVRVYLGPLTTYVETGVELSTGTWHHIAGTYDGSNVLIYVDGGLKKTVAKTGNQATFTSPVVIGKRDPAAGGGNQGVFDGLIDEVRISNVARTSFVTTSPPSVDGSTVALWHFDESVDPTASDETANDNDGTIQGASWAGPTWTTDGMFSNALSFDGTDDYVLVPDDDTP